MGLYYVVFVWLNYVITKTNWCPTKYMLEAYQKITKLAHMEY